MKRISSIILALLFFALTFSVALPQGTVSAAEGYWQLENVEIDQAEYNSDAIELVAERGFASYRNKDERSGDVFAASASWSEPRDSYIPGEEVKLSLSCAVDNYTWNGVEGQFHGGINYTGYHISARFDDPGVPYGFAGNSSIRLTDESGDNTAGVAVEVGKILTASDEIEVSAEMPNAYRDGDQIGLYVSASSTCNVVYIYTFKADAQPPEETTQSETEPDAQDLTIWLSGQALNVLREPLPRMKVTVDLFLDAADAQSGQASSKQYETVTDINGLFFVEIPLPKDQEKQVAILVKLHTTCKLPDNKTPFYLVDMKDAPTDDDIWAASLIKVDPSDAAFGQMGIIPVKRQFSFFYLMLDALSFSDDGSPDQYSSNVTDPYAVSAASYQYRMAWDALFFGSVILDEVEALKNSDLRIESRWERSAGTTGVSVSHFESDGIDRGGGTIRLTPDNCRVNDDSKFTILHEFGHYFDAITNRGETRATSLQPIGTANVNHGGYMNENTADSYMEGFASAFAAMVQKFRGDKNPHQIGPWNLGSPGRYVAYENVATNEEFSIATLLYQTSLLYPDKLDFWKVLDPNRKNFKEYYDALAEDLKDNEAKLSQLKSFAEKGGLYKMPFGSSQYEPGEPYVDANKNGQYDSGEKFGDLMFGIGSDGSIDTSAPIRPFTGNYEYGVSSDNLRTRNTVSKPANSYLYLDGSPVSDLTIRIYHEDGSESAWVASVENSKVFLPVANLEAGSWIDVSVPGGNLIFSGEAGQLNAVFETTRGLETPLATTTVFEDDISSSGQWALPAEGQTDYEQLLEVPDLTDIAAVNNSVADEPGDVNLSLDQLAAQQHGRPWRTGLGWEVILLLVSIGLFLILATALVLVIRQPKKTAVPVAHQTVQASGPAVATAPKFCQNCGAERKPDADFCHNCGKPYRQPPEV